MDFAPEFTDVSARHGGHHHTVNIKYGYVILGISLAHILARTAIHFCYTKKWNSIGTPSNNLKPLAKFPLWLTILLWAVTISLVSIHHVPELSENYVVVVKRFGRISYALIPFNIYLAFRPSNLFNSSWGYYLESIDLHKWISRLIFACAAIHSFGFAYKWITEGVLVAKILKLDNFLGVFVFLLVVALSVWSIRYIRRRFYRSFYILHQVLVWSFVILITFHARPGVFYIGIVCGLFLVVQAVQRFNCYYVGEADIEVFQNAAISSLQLVTIAKPHNFPSSYLVASHIRLSYSNAGYYSWLLPTHPFTLLSTADDDSQTLDLIVRQGQHFTFNPTYSTYALTGPYPSLPVAFFNTVQSLDVICGGSGISFGVTLLKYALSKSLPISIIWCVRNKNDVHVLKHLSSEIQDKIEIYVTGTETPLTLGDEANEVLLNQQQSDIEMSNIESSPKSFTQGRPKLDTVFSAEPSANHWTIACGPETLIAEAKKWSSDHQSHFFSEHYEM